jgi:hypothetical protein
MGAAQGDGDNPVAMLAGTEKVAEFIMFSTEAIGRVVAL